MLKRLNIPQQKSSTGFMVALSDAAGRARISHQGRSKFIK
jgi:hypothetical protein